MTTTLRETNLRDAVLLERIEASAGRTFALRRARAVVEVAQPDLRRLMRGGWIRRAGRGFYTITARPQLADEDRLRLATAPYEGQLHYVSWWAALAYHDLTEQDPLRICVAVQARRRERRVGALRIRPVLQASARFYGFETIRLPSGASIRVATPEKAIIDCLDRPDLGGGLPEIAKAFRITWAYDAGKLVRLARRHPSKALIARLGYLMTVLVIGDPTPLRGRVRRKGPPVALDLLAPPTEPGILDSTWRVFDNIGPVTLHQWADR